MYPLPIFRMLTRGPRPSCLKLLPTPRVEWSLWSRERSLSSSALWLCCWLSLFTMCCDLRTIWLYWIEKGKGGGRGYAPYHSCIVVVSRYYKYCATKNSLPRIMSVQKYCCGGSILNYIYNVYIIINVYAMVQKWEVLLIWSTIK